MIGDDLLVAPIVRPDVVRRLVYLPRGNWYDYWTNKQYKGNQTISVDAPLETVPMFVRAGSIIPTIAPMKYVGEKASDPITFNIYLDSNGTASTTLYEDDGVSPAYKEGKYRRTPVAVRRSVKGFVIDIQAAEGSYNPGERTFKFQIPSFEHVSKIVSAPGDGRAHQVELK